MQFVHKRTEKNRPSIPLQPLQALKIVLINSFQTCLAKEFRGIWMAKTSAAFFENMVKNSGSNNIYCVEDRGVSSHVRDMVVLRTNQRFTFYRTIQAFTFDRTTPHFACNYTYQPFTWDRATQPFTSRDNSLPV